MTDFLNQLIQTSDFAAAAANYYPFVGWSLGAEMRAADGTVTSLPPRYEVGLTTKSQVPASKIRLPSEKFGYVIFDPKPDDAASPRRLIDFDGENIVVK